MIRCDKSAGKYRVKLTVLHAAAIHGTDVVAVQIIGHPPIYTGEGADRRVVEEPPFTQTDKPYEGELCEHELAWLEDGVPGKDYRPEYLFEVEKLK